MVILMMLIMLFLSYVVALLGRNRKFGFWGYLICSVLFTPLIGLLLVLASDRRPDDARPKS